MMLDDLEAEVLEHLHGMDAQMTSEVARALKVAPALARRALHNLVAVGDVSLIQTPSGLELYEATQESCMPEELLV